MATFTAIFTPLGGSTVGSTTADLSATVAGTTSSAEILINKYQIFAINCAGDMNIRFGNVGMPAATAADFRIVGNATYVYQMTGHYDRIRLFNPNAGNVIYWIQPLAAAS